MSELADRLKDARERRIDDMLTHYRDVQDTLYESRPGGGGDGVIQTSIFWRQSGYPTLERLLRDLRDRFEAEERWPPYWHVREWYFRCAMTRVPLTMKDSHGRERKDGRGRPIQIVQDGVPQWEMRLRRYSGLPDEVRAMGEGQVRRALAWLASSWPDSARFEPEYFQEIVARLDREKAAA